MSDVETSLWRCDLCGGPCGPMWKINGGVDPEWFKENVTLRCLGCAATEAAEAITKEAASG